MGDLADLLLGANLALAGAVFAVVLLRIPARWMFGPRLSYGLWSLAPLAVAAALIPARVVIAPAPASPDIAAFAPHLAPMAQPAGARAALSGLELSPWLSGLWILGAVIVLVALWRSQASFNRAARQGRAGPAVIGVLKPRIVTPDDFAETYTPQEQRVVLIHEAIHIARQDCRINAVIALARCVAWFNPLVHLMGRLMRIDQEFACDAAVVARHPRARRVYAEALLKTQVTARALPFGCYWPVTTAHPLVERVSLLTRRQAGAWTRATGVTFMAVVTLGGAAAVWVARPPRVVLMPSHETAILARLVRNAPAGPKAASVKPPLAQTTPDAPPQRAVAAPTAEPAILAEAALTDAPRLMQVADFGPPPREDHIRGAAQWSYVEPGSAIRVVATMTDPDGAPLVTDLTAFGSQSLYRVGYVERHESRYKLFTSVTQHGDRFRVTASLGSRFLPRLTGDVDLASGETGTIRLPTGQWVTVTPVLRAETPEELAAARALRGRFAVNVERFEQSL